jgi:ADP-ribose pyrophosphatase
MTLQRHPAIALLESRRIFDGRIFAVVEESLRLPSGLRQDLAIVDHPGAVAIAALDRSNEMLLVNQYRHAAGDWLLEIPAGRLEKDEAPLAAAQRELEEETGHRAATWRLLRELYPAPGFCSERMFLFLATDLAHVTDGARAKDPDEEIELVRATPAAILDGEIALAGARGSVGAADAKTLVAAALVIRFLERGIDAIA